MNRRCIKPFLAVLLLLLPLLVPLVKPLPFITSFFLGIDADDECLLATTSPDGTYALTAYRIREGVTVADSIRVYRDFGPVTGCIYNEYREQTVSLVWISNAVVEINGVVLDLSKGETYDWRR